MNVVLDTNVLVSGTFWTGSSFRVLELVDKGKVTLIANRPILDEYDEALHKDEIIKKPAYSTERVKAALNLLKKVHIVEQSIKLNIVNDDADDNKFIEAAVEGNADYIVSKDKHLLRLKQYKNIKIITPEEFLSLNLKFTKHF